MEPLFWPKLGQIPIRNLRRQLRHAQLFWREVGQGSAVVFLHGSWQDGDQWSQVLSKLGANYHCLAPDLIGFGESKKLDPASDYSIALQVKTLQELLASLRLTSVVLVGHSLGAWVATRYALKNPEQVRGLCVLEPEGVVHNPKQWRRERWLASPFGGLWLALTGLWARRATHNRRTAWLQQRHLRQRLKSHPAACRLLFQRRRPALDADMVGGQLAALSMPMVVVHGVSMGNTSQQLTQTFLQAAPNSRVKALATEDGLMEDGDAIASFLQEWLTTL